MSRMRMLRGQASIEYIMLLGFTMVLLFPLLYLFYSESGDFASDVTAAQFDQIAQSIINNADAVYYHGEPSQETLVVQFPPGIKAVTIQGSSLTILVQGRPVPYEVVKWSAANLTGSIDPHDGAHRLTIRAMAGGVQIIDN
jgi:hypothetical protein